MKRIITLLLSALMVVTLGTANVFGDGNVAKIGDNEYPTLADAVSVVQDGETITMLQSISDVDTGLPSNKNYTLDLNKKTISFKPTGYLLSEVGTKNIIIKNGTITVDGSNLPKYSSSCEYLIGLTNSNGSLTFDGADITFDGITNPNGGNDYFIFNFDDGIINFNNSKLTVKNSAQVFYAINNQKGTIDAKNSEFTFDKISDVIFHCDKVTSDNCTITSTDSANASVFAHSSLVAKNGSVVTIDESYPPFYGWCEVKHGENFQVDSTSQVVTTNSNEWGINFGNATINEGAVVAFDEEVTILKSANIASGHFLGGITKDDGATISLTGGYYKNDVTDFCAPGYDCVPDTTIAGCNYKVTMIPIAKIDDTVYPSLETAINEVKNNETIVLLKDITVDSIVEIPNEKSFTIDLNEKTITTSAVTGFDINSANLTVKNGTVINNNSDGLSGSSMETRTKVFFLEKTGEGSLTLDEVKITSTGYSINVNNNNNGNGAKNKSVVINNCDISSGKWAAVYAGGTDNSNELAISNSKLHSSWTGTTMGTLQICMKTTIEKTTITNDYGAALACFENTDLLLKGTENNFTAAAGAISTNGSKDLVQIAIEGGTYKTTGTSKEAGIAFYHPDGSPLTIEGGTFEGATALYVKGGTIDIQGGSFIGTGTYSAAQKVSSGAYATGDAVAIEASNYLSGETYPHDPNPSVTISGGLFTSTNGSPIGYYEFDGNKETHEGKMISGGWFSSKVPNTTEKDLVVSGYKASDSLENKGAPNSINVYTVIKDIPKEDLENKETSTVKEDGKDVDTTFGTKVTIDETLPAEEKEKISSIQVSNLNKAISTTEKNNTIAGAAVEAAKDTATPTVEVEVVMNVELAKANKIESLAEKIEEDKAGEYTPNDVEYIDITVDKIVKANGKVIEIKDVKTTDAYQIISFPVDKVLGQSADKEKVFVYRNHIDAAGNETNTAFKKVTKDYGPLYNEECYWIDGDKVYIKAKNFSIYGFGVQNSVIPAEEKLTPAPTPSHDDSSIDGYKIPKTGIR